MYWIITKGKRLEVAETIVTPESGRFLGRFSNFDATQFSGSWLSLAQIITTHTPEFWMDFQENSQLRNWEIIAGIVLGPLLGMYFPEFSGALFPVESLGNLKF
jgi:hypothetical protein